LQKAEVTKELTVLPPRFEPMAAVWVEQTLVANSHPMMVRPMS
jgi:hypothetical protein